MHMLRLMLTTNLQLRFALAMGHRQDQAHQLGSIAGYHLGSRFLLFLVASACLGLFSPAPVLDARSAPIALELFGEEEMAAEEEVTVDAPSNGADDQVSSLERSRF